MIRTAKFLLIDPPEQQLRKTTLAFTQAMQFVADQITQTKTQDKQENQETSSAPTIRPNLTALRKVLYQTLRKQFSLPSQMAQTAPKLALAAVKTAWKKTKNGSKKSVTVRFTRPQAMFQYNRDYSLLQKKDGLYASIKTLDGRVRCRLSGGGFLEKRFLQGGWRAKAARLYENRNNKRFYLLVYFEKDPPKHTLERLKSGECVTVLGVDRGLRNTAAVRVLHAHKTNDKGGLCVDYGDVLLFRGGVLREKRRRYLELRARLQSRGTRSAKRLLKKLSGREKRFFADTSRQIAKKIINQALKHQNPVIALEDLKNITRRIAKKKPIKTKANGQTVSKRLHWEFSSWHHKVLLQAIVDKAEEHGVSVVFVDPKYSSQTCPRCFHVSKDNREKNLFKCLKCGYSNNADISAASIIGLRSLEDLYGFEAGAPISCPTPQEHLSK